MPSLEPIDNYGIRTSELTLLYKEDKAMPDPEDKPKGDEQDTVSKADFEKLQADKDRLEKDLEDTRMEVLTPEYQKFLDSLEKGGEEKDKDKDKTPSEGKT